MTRHAKFLWMKDLLEHLDDCHREWQVAEGRAEQYLADSIQRHLHELGRVCDSLRNESYAADREAIQAM